MAAVSPVLGTLHRGDIHISTYHGTSQYSRGGVSACALASFNAVRCVFELQGRGLDGTELITEMARGTTIEVSLPRYLLCGPSQLKST